MRCIYCLEIKSKSNYLKREHVIPQCFGKFSPDNLILYETVCDNCNKYFGEKLELFLGRDSLEGVERLRHGIKPKEPLKNRRRVKSKICKGEWKGVIVIESHRDDSNEVGLEKVVQAGFYNKFKHQYDYFEPKDIPSADELKRNGYKIRNKKIWLIAEKGHELDSLIELLYEKGIKVSIGDKSIEYDKINEKFNVQMELTIDRTIFRAISKIAFNYLSYVAGKRFLFDDTFNEIRRFIRYDEGKSDRFIGVNAPPILYDDQKLEKFSIKVTEGHLINLGWRGKGLFSKISLFNTSTYLIKLCNSFNGIWRPINSGHHFDIDSKKISKLVSVRKSIMQ